MWFNMPVGGQVRLKPSQKRHTIATLPLEGPVAVKSLHELTLPGYRQVACDFTEPTEKQTAIMFQELYT